jgi:hypothetical protein
VTAIKLKFYTLKVTIKPLILVSMFYDSETLSNQNLGEFTILSALSLPNFKNEHSPQSSNEESSQKE